MADSSDVVREAALAMHELTGRAITRCERSLVKMGITFGLCEALMAISPDEPPPAMKTVAARLRCDRSTVTFLVDRLAERGLVERMEDPNDRRSKALRLTAGGKRMRTRALNEVVAHSPLSTLNDKDLGQLLALLTKTLKADTANEASA